MTDLAAAHLLALDALRGGAASAHYNLGNGRPTSVREVVDAVERVTGTPVPLYDRARGGRAIRRCSSPRASASSASWAGAPRFEDDRHHRDDGLALARGASARVRPRGPRLMSRLKGQLTDPLLSVVMPVYNERDHDRGDHPAGARRPDPHRADRRRRRVEGRDARHPDRGSRRELPFKLILQPANAGKGAALRRGFQEVTGDLVVIQDADLEYSPEEFPELIELICEGRADVVYGSRFLGRHRVFLFTHYVGNRFLTLVTNVLYNTMLTDMETCYKVMRTEVLRSMTLESDGFGIEPELTAKIFKRHYRVYEVPITYDGRGYDEGKKITWRDGFVALWVLLKYRFTE